VPWPVYSETFVKTAGQQGYFTYLVPGGKRAIVRQVIAINYADVTGYVNCQVAGVCCSLVLFPAAPRNSSLAVMVVAYAGALIAVSTSVPGFHVSMSGYLMSDLSGLQGAPPASGQLPAPDPGPPPS
jgi:hypothetical protein